MLNHVSKIQVYLYLQPNFCELHFILKMYYSPVHCLFRGRTDLYCWPSWNALTFGPTFLRVFPLQKEFLWTLYQMDAWGETTRIRFFLKGNKKEKYIIIRCKNNQLHLELGTLGCARITATSCLPRLFLCFVFYLRRYNVLRLFSFTKPPCPHTPSRWSIPGKLIKVLADPMHWFFFLLFLGRTCEGNAQL